MEENVIDILVNVESSELAIEIPASGQAFKLNLGKELTAKDLNDYVKAKQINLDDAILCGTAKPNDFDTIFVCNILNKIHKCFDCRGYISIHGEKIYYFRKISELKTMMGGYFASMGDLEFFNKMKKYIKDNDLAMEILFETSDNENIATFVI